MISQIRKYIWVVVLLMALALVGLLVQSAMSDGPTSLFGNNSTTLGKVNGEKIQYNDFARSEDLLYANSNSDVYARRNSLWNYFVEEILVREEAEQLGIGVSKAELLDLQFGPNPSPVIQQRFFDQATGQLDRTRLNEFKTAIDNNTLTDPSIRAFWANQEKEVIKDRTQSKLAAMVSKAIYTPTWMAEMGFKEQNERVDIAFVRAAFDEIDNSDIALENADYEAYLNENKAQFEQKEETRRVGFVVLDVFATAADSAKNQKVINDLVSEFQTTDNDSAFVTRNNGFIDETYYKKTELSTLITNAAIVDTLYKLPVGSVYGPYIENGSYQAVKVVERKVIPDSVRSRHILIQAQDAVGLAAAQSRVDSLKNLIETGKSTFDTLARIFGSDATRDKGGDLGFAFPNMMVKPFNDLIFYKAEPNKLYTVVTQFGAHLVEVTDRKYTKSEQGVRIAALTEPIVPSEETQNAVYERALAMAANYRSMDKLEAAVKKDSSLSAENSPLLKENDFTLGTLGTGQTARDIVRWVFDAKKGAVSSDVYSFQNEALLYIDKYVVAGLKNIQKAGIPSVESIKADIQQQVANRKKGEVLQGRMKGKDFAALATEFSTQIDTARTISFATPSLPNVGNEPKVIAAAFAMEKGAKSAPIVGASGVYVFELLEKIATIAPSPSDLASVRVAMSTAMQSVVPSRLMQSLKNNAKIKDNRFTFF